MSAALIREPIDGKYYATVSGDIDCIAVSQTVGTGLPRPARRIYVGGAGDLNLVSTGGSTVFFSSIPAGTVIDLETKTVLQSTTNATKITVLF